MSRNVALEYQRFQACSERRRADCKPSLIWLLSDWKAPTSTVILNTQLDGLSQNVRTPSASSSNPLLPQEIEYVSTSTISIHFPEDIQNENDPATKLRAIQTSLGQRVSINVTAPTSVARVEVFIGDMVSSNSEKAFPTKPAIILTKNKTGVFTGNWVYPATGFSGPAHLEVRTYASAKGSMVANAKYDHVTYLVAIKK